MLAAVLVVTSWPGGRGGMHSGQHSASTHYLQPSPHWRIIWEAGKCEGISKAVPWQHSGPCCGVTTAALDTRCHCRAGSPAPAGQAGYPWPATASQSKAREMPKLERSCLLREGPGRGHPSAEQGSLHHTGVRVGHGMGYNFHAQSSVASLENQYRVYSLDGSVDPEKQERPSWVEG